MTEGGFDQQVPSEEEATLGDVLELVRTMQAACAEDEKKDQSDLLKNTRDISSRERLSIGLYPDKPRENEDGNVIGHITLTERDHTGAYKLLTHYSILRDPSGDETSTRMIAFGNPELTPGDIYGNTNPRSAEGILAAQINIVGAELGMNRYQVRPKGKFTPIKGEVGELKSIITKQFLTPKQ